MGYRTFEISSTCEIHIKEGQFDLNDPPKMVHRSTMDI